MASLLPQPASADTPASGFTILPLSQLEPSPFQPRHPLNPDELVELADSIRAQGVLQPILVRPHPHEAGRFQIIAGERRWRAAKLAGLSDMPCFTRDMPDVDAGAAALIENLQRRDLNPIEEAEGYRRLMQDFRLTQDEVGAAIGKSRSHVANLLRLLGLPQAVKALVQAGTLTAGHARAAIACEDPVAAAELMVAKGMTVRQAEALSARGALPPAEQGSSTTREQSNPDIRAVEADLAQQLGLQVSISFNGRGGTISLRYQNLDQLDHVVARLGRVQLS